MSLQKLLVENFSSEIFWYRFILGHFFVDVFFVGISLQTLLVEISLLGFWWRSSFPKIFWTFSAGVYWYECLFKEILVEISLQGFW